MKKNQYNQPLLSKKECSFLVNIIETEKIKLDSLNLNEKENEALQEPKKLLTSIGKKLEMYCN